jgi:hypothetical protein
MSWGGVAGDMISIDSQAQDPQAMVYCQRNKPCCIRMWPPGLRGKLDVFSYLR